MVKCEFCIFYADGVCTSENGMYAGMKIEDSYDDISCRAYIDNGIAMSLIPNDGIMDDIFLLD